MGSDPAKGKWLCSCCFGIVGAQEEQGPLQPHSLGEALCVWGVRGSFAAQTCSGEGSGVEHLHIRKYTHRYLNFSSAASAWPQFPAQTPLSRWYEPNSLGEFRTAAQHPASPQLFECSSFRLSSQSQCSGQGGFVITQALQGLNLTLPWGWTSSLAIPISLCEELLPMEKLNLRLSPIFFPLLL